MRQALALALVAGGDGERRRIDDIAGNRTSEHAGVEDRAVMPRRGVHRDGHCYEIA